MILKPGSYWQSNSMLTGSKPSLSAITSMLPACCPERTTASIRPSKFHLGNSRETWIKAGYLLHSSPNHNRRLFTSNCCMYFINTDAGRVADSAKDAVVFCLNNGIVNGRSPSLLAADTVITRAEVATIIQRVLENSGLI